MSPAAHTASAPAPTPALARARVAVAAAFLTQGMVFINLTTRLPSIRDRWDLSELQLSGLLLMMVLLAGVGSLAAEALAGRHPSAVLLRAGLGLVVVSVPLVVLAPDVAVLLTGLAGYGVALGVVDATTNMQAVALEHRFGRPILPSFHGAWTLGGVAGSALTLATGDLALGWSALVAAVPLAVAVAAPLLPRAGTAADPSAAAVPWRPIILVGTAMVLFYMVDTAASTWGPTYLDDTFATPSRLVALATFPYLVASGLVRLAGDGLVARFGPVPVLRAGAVVAATALAVVVSAPSWPVAVLGFTLLGAGAAVIAPLSFSAAARLAGEGPDGRSTEADEAARLARVDAVIARFNQFNYVGALLGAVLTGTVGSGSLRIGFAVPMVLVLAIWPLAVAFGSGPELPYSRAGEPAGTGPASPGTKG